MEGHNTLGQHALYEETAFVIVATESAGDALLNAYLSALKGCSGDEICPWLP